MKRFKITKVLNKQKLDLSLNINHINENNVSKDSGFIYTIYNKFDMKITIGFNKRIETIREIGGNPRYILLESRKGSIRELKILKATLMELGHKHDISDEYYLENYSLLKHLKNLGWPIGKLSKKIKKYH